MLRMKHAKLITYIIMAILLVGCFNINLAYADSDVIIKVGDAITNDDGTYSVPVSIENNPGLAGVMFKLNYDNQLLQVVDVTPANGLFSSPMINTTNTGIINYVYVAASNEKSNGTIYTVKFKPVSKTSYISSCVTKLTVSDIDLCDSDLKSITGKGSDNTIDVAVGSNSNSGNGSNNSTENVTNPGAAGTENVTGSQTTETKNEAEAPADIGGNEENAQAESSSAGSSGNNNNDSGDNNISKYIIIGAIVIMCGICAAMGVMWYKAK